MCNQKLEQYGILMSYLQYENTTYWSRANFFLLASSALFGFVATNLPPPNTTTPWERIVVLFVISIFGLFLSLLWRRSLQVGELWIDHWHSILKDLEPDAFGEHKLLREFQPKLRAKRVTRQTLYLFYGLWSSLIFYSLVTFGIKVFN